MTTNRLTMTVAVLILAALLMACSANYQATTEPETETDKTEQTDEITPAGVAVILIGVSVLTLIIIND